MHRPRGTKEGRERDREHTINSSIAILISLADHLIDFLVGQLLANGCHDMAKLGCGDEAVVIAVEDLVTHELDYSTHLDLLAHLESFADLILRIGILHLSRHHGQELCPTVSHWKRHSRFGLSANLGNQWCHCCQHQPR